MKGFFVVSLAVASALAASSCRDATAPQQSAAPAATGTIRGHVRLTGRPPENPAIRLRADPMCDKMNAGKPAVQEAIVVSPDGSLANVLVQLQGSFPVTAAPTEAVTIDQRGCIYSPRVVGIRVGQPLRVLNSDPGLHNVHGVSAGNDAFNVGQPIAGMVNEFRLKDEGILQLKCDVHGWMVAFVGVVSHPYFAVTGTDGTFELRDVPTGTHTIQAWHEQYGLLTSNVRVEAGGVADVDFAYSGEEKRSTPP
jgi:plastocyanin